LREGAYWEKQKKSYWKRSQNDRGDPHETPPGCIRNEDTVADDLWVTNYLDEERPLPRRIGMAR
jgi:hypothetical protein